MTPFIHEATPEKPEVILDKGKNHFEMKGKSFPEEARSFYYPIIDWLKEYIRQPNEKTPFHIKMDYYNTASSKMILEMLKVLQELHKNGGKVEIHWHYPEDDEDMLEAGEDYEEILQLPFHFVTT